MVSPERVQGTLRRPAAWRRWALAAAVGAATASGAVYAYRQRIPDPPFAYGMKLAQARDVHPVTLRGTDGPVLLPYRDGRWTLLFFGYTHCPDVCPTTLAYLHQEMRAMGTRAADLHVVFVSVDPGRDTAAGAAQFALFYDPQFTGLTGDKAALDQLTTDAGAAYLPSKPLPGTATYEVMHSSSVYVVNPAGRVVALYGGTGAPGRLAQDFAFLPARS